MSDEQAGGKGSPQAWSRYQRVKEILNEAAGSANPSYQGQDRFWNLPHQEFLAAQLYGIPLIAPAPGRSPFQMAPASCCHPQPSASAPSGPSPAVRTPGRGAASGLIKGLKGQFPFDGTQWPPLPWGGQRVSGADIAFIENWIDDGCPEKDEPAHGVEVSESRALALASGREAHPLSTAPANAFQDEKGKPKIRPNIEFMPPDQLARFRAAIAKMKSLDAFYQDERSFGFWARIHANQCQHSWEEFLTWHRAYLYFFEQQLQDCDSTVTLPYWDWPLYKEDIQKSIDDMGSATYDNGVIPEAYRCWIDPPGLAALAAVGKVPQDVLDRLNEILLRKFDSGTRLFKAASIEWGKDPDSDQAIIDQLGAINPLWHYLRWPGGNKNLIFEVYPAPEDIQRILQIGNFFQFGSGPADNHFFGALENIHNLMHNFSGGLNPNYKGGNDPMNIQNPQAGDMVNAGRTAFDPIFWGHHSNVDRLWSQWQVLHPSAGPDNPDDTLAPFPMAVSDTYSISSLGYEYAQSAHLFLTSSAVPITQFRSANAEVHPKVLQSHQRAEVRLHRVHYVTRAGFFIRVFLNQPGADASTPTQGNQNYVGTLNMFTGLCIGGPGHCDTPSETRRKFDHRSRHHKTPANFRIDATDAAARLRGQGATDFQVNLVVLNIDGTPATDALRLDAVSLNFFD
ncbi:MAG: tyrosinase family protein [Terriglobia bacterium]